MSLVLALILILQYLAPGQCVASSAESIENLPIGSILDSGCLRGENLTLADITKYNDQVELAKDDYAFKCFVACFLEYSTLVKDCKLMNESGNSDISAFISAVAGCIDSVTSTERCECEYQVMKCIQGKY